MKYLKIIVKVFVAFMFLGVMYYFSRQNGIDSDTISRKCTEIFINTFGHIGLGRVAQKFLFYVDIRKIAHFVLFFLFSMICYLIFSFENIKLRYSICFILSLLLAAADEIHQSFISGRTATISDVFIDIIGASFGLLIVYFLLLLINTIKRKKCEKN